MSVFESSNYRKLIRSRINSLPKSGYGQAKQLARHLSVSTTLISQVLSERRHFTIEQAYLVTEFFGFNELEARYFITLVNYERAATSGLREWLKRDLDEIKGRSHSVAARLSHQKALSDEQKGVFYSDWHYSAVRMLTSIPNLDSVDAIAKYIGAPRKLVQDIINFLVQAELIKDDSGQLTIGPLSTHVGPDSPWAKLHHSNWRARALESLTYPNSKKVNYTSPMTLSRLDVEKVRSLILNLIEAVGKIVDPSPSEELYCLNIDWFRVQSPNDIS